MALSSANASFHNWSAVEQTEVIPGIFRQQIDTDHLTIIRYVYQAGSVFPQHSHGEEQVTTILSGSIEFAIDGHTQLFGPGDVAIIPGNTAHGARVTGDQTVETLNILYPRRRIDPATN